MGCFKLKYHFKTISPFGMGLMNYVNEEYAEYRYGFNGKETETESFNGAYAFEARIYDARIGRWLSTDPKERDYAWQSTYAYFKNSPIAQLDYLGMGGEEDPPPSPTNALSVRSLTCGFCAFGTTNFMNEWDKTIVL